MPYTKFVFPVSILVLVFLVLVSTTDNDSLAGEELEFMNGVSFVAPPSEFTHDPFKSVLDVNSNWVAIMPYSFTNVADAKVIFDSEQQWWGESTEGIVRTIEYAKQNRLKTLLKPHVWVRDQGWAGEFKLKNEEDWFNWEKSYEDYVLNLARVADSLNVEAFCIGLELKHVVKERPEYWKKLIGKVKQEYKGKITYAANWDNFQTIPFWEKLDFIGINAYFPLSQEESPSEADLIDAWQDKKRILSDLSEKYGKPIVFTEYGYRSIDKAAGNQWELEPHRRFEGEPNFVAQEKAYAVLFETFWEEPWFKGGFLWKWYPDQQGKLEASNSDYTPQKKPVEKVIEEWYKKR